MPAPNAERVSYYRRMPPSWQWGIPCTLALLFIAALIVFVRHQTDSAPSVAVSNAQQQKAENHLAYITMRQEEQAHVAAIASDVSPAVALEHAVSAWVDKQVKANALSGPLQHVTCTTSTAGGSSTSGSDVALKCTAVAAQVKYSFEGVVDKSSRTATYCQKIDYAPAVGEKLVPVPSACT